LWWAGGRFVAVVPALLAVGGEEVVGAAVVDVAGFLRIAFVASILIVEEGIGAGAAVAGAESK